MTVGSALAGLSNNGNPSSVIMGIMIVRNVVPPPPHSGQRMSAVSVFQAVCLHKLLAPTDW